MLNKIRHFIGKRYNLVRYLYSEYKFLFYSLGSCDTAKSQNKQREQLIMASHVIEKGLSLKDTRSGFGVPKILDLLMFLDRYMNNYKDQETFVFVLSIIEAYMDFHNKKSVPVDAEIIKRYNELAGKYHKNHELDNLQGGTLLLSRDNVQNAIQKDFESFAQSRHSIRQFTGNQIDIALLRKAFQIAESTPSACNRQPWCNYVFTQKENIVRILDIQRGARQFKNDVAALIVVTATPNAFYGQEYHQHLVNGGLYAMNLLYAIHSQGLGAIPLNGGISNDQKKQIMDICNDDGNNDLIILIAVGEMPDNFAVAKSARIKYSNYTKFDTK